MQRREKLLENSIRIYLLTTYFEITDQHLLRTQHANDCQLLKKKGESTVEPSRLVKNFKYEFWTHTQRNVLLLAAVGVVVAKTPWWLWHFLKIWTPTGMDHSVNKVQISVPVIS